MGALLLLRDVAEGLVSPVDACEGPGMSPKMARSKVKKINFLLFSIVR